jgi:sarcosine oxidase subunit gamma
MQAETPFAGLAPVTAAEVSLSEIAPGRMTSIAPYKGKTEALSEALVQAHGLIWPAPGRMTGAEDGRLIWFAREMALLIGPDPDPSLAAHAALTDQSDAWAVLQLAGPGVRDVLARLCPLDLRAQVFVPGHTARTALGHMTASVSALEEDLFWVMVFRSMAGTLAHEMETAIHRVAARRVPG